MTANSKFTTSQSLYENPGLYDCHLPEGSMGPMAQENTAKFLSNAVGRNINASADLHSQSSEAIHVVVDICPQSQETPTYSPPATEDSYIRCQTGRLGSSLSRLSGPGTLVIPIRGNGFKYTGNQSSLPGTSGVCSNLEREECPDTHG